MAFDKVKSNCFEIQHLDPAYSRGRSSRNTEQPSSSSIFDPVDKFRERSPEIEIYVDLVIDSTSPDEQFGGSQQSDVVIQEQLNGNTDELGDLEDCQHEQLNDSSIHAGDFGECPYKQLRDTYGQPASCGEFQDEQLVTTELIQEKASFLVQHSSALVSGVSSDHSINPDDPKVKYSWPEWGDPLPPEDSDEDEPPAKCAKSATDSKALSTFDSRVNARLPLLTGECGICCEQGMHFEAPGILECRQSEFHPLMSHDDNCQTSIDEDDGAPSPGTDNNTSSGHLSAENEYSTDLSAARQLLEMSRVHNSNAGPRWKVSEIAELALAQLNNANNFLEEVSGLVERLYAAIPQLSCLSNSREKLLAASAWMVEVSADCRKLKMRRIEPDLGSDFDSFIIPEVDDEREVLHRPPWKRQYKSLKTLL